MKKISFIALAAIMIVAVGTGMAFAASYDVTTNFGVRVTEKGISEQVGSTTLTPSNDADANAFTNGQIITVELLGLATISHTIVADYNFADDAPAFVDAYDAATDDLEDWTDPLAPGFVALPVDGYRVTAIEGNDFFTVTVVVTNPATVTGADVVAYGHDENSRICVNLEDTLYNSADPAQQLVKASYADNKNNTFSGDTDIATVKPKSVQIAVCDKSNEIEIYDFTGQGPACGPIQQGSFCLTFEDTATSAFQDGDDYIFALGKKEGAKAGVGIGTITIEDPTGGVGHTITPGAADYTRYDRLGNEIVLADFDSDDDFTDVQKLYAATAYVEVKVTFAAPVAGPQKYTLKGTLYQDTCLITPGDYMIDLMANKVPCGASFSETDILAAEFITATGYEQVFPYAVAGIGSWFNGLVITNPNSTAVTVNFTIQEADGDVYTGSTTVDGNEMAVGFAADVMSPTTTGTDETFGDEPYAIYATGTGEFYGFIFIGNGTMAQGYLPIMKSMLH